MVRLATCVLVATMVVSGCSDEQDSNNTDNDPATSNSTSTAEQNNDESNQNNDDGASWTLVITDLDEAAEFSVPEEGFDGDSAVTMSGINDPENGKRIQFAAKDESVGFVELADKTVIESGGTTTAIFNFGREEPLMQCSNPLNERDPGEMTVTVTSTDPLNLTVEGPVVCTDDRSKTADQAVPAQVSATFENVLNVL